jgi:uncharacterized membrane protein YdjX (TVP38/TMEM64 family)
MLLAALAAALLIALLGFSHVSGAQWKEAVHGMPAPALLICCMVLPLTGFPVTVLLVALGARFGVAAGLGITALTITIHLCASYPLAGLLRRPVVRLLDSAGWELPTLDRGTAWTFALWLALAPGLSYALKNYTSPLAGVPFRVFFPIYLPVHLATSIIGLMLGGATMDFSWPLAAGLLVYAAVLCMLSRQLFLRLREKHPAPAATHA